MIFGVSFVTTGFDSPGYFIDLVYYFVGSLWQTWQICKLAWNHEARVCSILSMYVLCCVMLLRCLGGSVSKKHAPNIWCVLSLEIGGFMLGLKQTILSFKIHLKEWKLQGLGLLLMHTLLKSLGWLFYCWEKWEIDHCCRLSFWIPITHPIYIYICLFTRGYLFFNSSLYVFHPMWVVFWGRPGPAKWFSFPSCLPEPSSWLSGCCVKWTDRNLETFLLSFCYPHVGVVFKFGLVSEKTHFGVIYFKHVLTEENHGEFGWHYFFNIKNFRMHHLRKTNSWSCGVLHGIFPVDGVSHGRLHWVWNCFVFWNSSNPNGRSLRIVRVFGTYRKLPFFLSIYIYICHLNFVLKLAPHLLQSGIAG